MLGESPIQDLGADVPDAEMIRQQVEGRIAELEAALGVLRAEQAQLKALAATFAADGASAPRAAPSRRRRRAGASAAMPGGSRAHQAVTLMEAQPGITASELAKAMGISRNYLYRVLPKLERRGVIRKQGQGYHVAAAG
jgi:transposase-like protein